MTDPQTDPIERPRPCRHCDGTGEADGEQCWDCNGLKVDAFNWWQEIRWQREQRRIAEERLAKASLTTEELLVVKKALNTYEGWLLSMEDPDPDRQSSGLRAAQKTIRAIEQKLDKP